MKKGLKNFLLMSFTLGATVLSPLVFAIPILNIIPNVTNLNVPLNSSDSVHFSATNNTNKSINKITIDPKFNVTGNIVTMSLLNNTCDSTTLSPGATCYFDVAMQGNKLGQLLLTPRVCGYQGAICSVPTVNNRVDVTVTSSPTKAYIANDFNIGKTVSKCNIVNGNLTSCTTAASGFRNPHSIIINPQSNLAYVVDPVDNSISKCSFAANGDLNCVNSGATGLNRPFGISIRENFAYVTNMETNTVSKFLIDANGNLSFQNETGSAFTGPDRIFINGSFAYITNFTNDTVTLCSIQANGDFNPCTNSGASSLNNPVGIAINGTNAYISNFSNTGLNANSITKCNVNTNGSLTSCNVMTSATGFLGPEGLVIDSSIFVAYVTNARSNSVSKCSIDANQNFVNCVPTGSGFIGPTGIALK